MCSDGTYGNFYAFSSPANEKVGFKIHPKFLVVDLLVCPTHSLFLFLFRFLSLLSLYVDDQKEIF